MYIYWPTPVELIDVVKDFKRLLFNMRFGV
jgi:hypothetical protein